MLENIYKLKKLLLYKEIKEAKGNKLELTDGTKIEFYMSDNDCCAVASGEWILSDEFEGCITNVDFSFSDEDFYGGRCVTLKLTIYHNQNKIAQADCYADNGNAGYYFSVLSVNVKNIDDKQLDDYILLSV